MRRMKTIHPKFRLKIRPIDQDAEVDVVGGLFDRRQQQRRHEEAEDWP